MARPRRRGSQARSWVIWPTYFDSRLTRAQGRRVPREIAVRNPKLEELSVALKAQGFEANAQESSAHPGFWISPQGRVLVPLSNKVDSKEQLLKETAKFMKKERQSRS